MPVTSFRLSSSHTPANVFDFSLSFDPKQYPVQYGVKRQVWVENLDSIEERRLALLDLHPDIFSAYPRMDLIHANIVWQKKYSTVNYNHVRNVKEMIEVFGGGAKPWPQKGTGRARQGSIRAPQWVNGGKAHGPRGPRSFYYMPNLDVRVYGLTHTLSVKFVQDDLHVVNNLEIPTDDPSFITDLIKTRGWGMSTLIVDATDEMPRNITAATDKIPYVNLMPVYGLNVLSMTKHQTLVLTEAAVEHITRRLLFALHRTDRMERHAINLKGPQEITLKLEKHRPVV